MTREAIREAKAQPVSTWQELPGEEQSLNPLPPLCRVTWLTRLMWYRSNGLRDRKKNTILTQMSQEPSQKLSGSFMLISEYQIKYKIRISNKIFRISSKRGWTPLTRPGIFCVQLMTVAT